MGVINLGILIRKVLTKIAGEGYIKADSYATTTTGGTIKTSSTYATTISSGVLKAAKKTAEQYAELSDDAFISKGTLDNVLAAQPSGGVSLTKILDANYPDYLGGEKTLTASFTDANLMIFVTTKSGVQTSSVAVAPVSGGKYRFTGDGTAVTATLSASSGTYKVTFNASGTPTDDNIKIYIC